MQIVANVNQRRCCVEESEQWLENADQTHLVLASGKLVLQKSLSNEIFCSEFRSGQAFHLYQVVGSIFLLLLLQVSSEMALRKKMAMLETDQQDKSLQQINLFLWLRQFGGVRRLLIRGASITIPL